MWKAAGTHLFLGLMLAGPWPAFPVRIELLGCSSPYHTRENLFLKSCQSFLRSKNNVLVRWISDRLVVSTGTRHCIFWEGSSKTHPFHWHLGRFPGVFGSGLLQMPPRISRPGFEDRDCTTCCSLGWTGSLLPDIWKVFQTLQPSWPSTAQAPYLGGLMGCRVAR